MGDQETTAAGRAWMFQQSSGALSELTFDPSESGASASGISDSGIIAGEEISQTGLHAGFWTVTGGAMLLNGQSDSEWAVAANDNGTVLGDYGDSGSPGSAAFTWSSPGYAQTVLPGLRCDNCARLMISANAINDSGTAVGQSQSAVYDNNGAFVSGGLFAVEWQSGTATSLGSLQDSGTSAAYGINNSGDIVGSSRVGQASGAPSHAFLYHQGTMADLGVLQGDANSSASSINDLGQIVGMSSDAAGTQRAFLYQNGQMYDLNSLIDPASPLAGQVALQQAVAVSSNGLIAVDGTDSQDPGWTRAFLLIPAQ